MDILARHLREAIASTDPLAVDRMAAAMDADDEKRRARLEAPDAIFKAALWYAKKGLKIFPLSARSKKPHANTNGLKDATSDLEQIRAWWQRWPDSNVALATGHLVDVIDIDGPDGVRWWAREMYGPQGEYMGPPLLGWVSTPRNGGHHLYVQSDPRRRNGAKLVDGIDARATGGYVLLPPSVTDEHGHGRRYAWLKPLEIEAQAAQAVA